MTESNRRLFRGLCHGAGGAFVSTAIYNSGIVGVGPFGPTKLLALGLFCIAAGIVAGVVWGTERSTTEATA